jgi:hypothetical protein
VEGRRQFGQLTLESLQDPAVHLLFDVEDASCPVVFAPGLPAPPPALAQCRTLLCYPRDLVLAAGDPFVEAGASPLHPPLGPGLGGKLVAEADQLRR